MRSPTRLICRVVFALLGMTLMTACVNSQAGPAQQISDDIAALPGVRTVDHRYLKTFERGEEFQLTAELEPSASSEQAQQVARTFVDAVSDGRFTGGSYVRLSLNAPRSGVEIAPLGDDGPVLTADQAAERVARTFTAAASPAVDHLSIGGVHGTTIRLRQPVDHDAADALRRDYPELDGDRVEWQLFFPPVEGGYLARTFTSVGAPPDPALAQLWPELVRVAAPSTVYGEHARGVTTVWIDGPGSVAAPAQRVAPLLAALDRPVRLEQRGGGREGIQVTIGGCFEHGATHQESDAERELAAQYERC